MSVRQRLCVLGATGSIGQSTLDVVARHPDRYEVFALTAYNRVDELAQLCARWQPALAVVASAQDAQKLQILFAQYNVKQTHILMGEEGLIAAASAPEVDVVMAAIVGAAGLLPTLAAVKKSKRVLLANKEALVMSGALFMEAAAQANALILPIDSEHNAIFQCLPTGYSCGDTPKAVEKLVLTASGGPFRTWSAEQIAQATPAQAVKHPKWSMGRKISVDSASLMNKGLEMIEASWLFALPEPQIQVVIHPESIIHSLVQYKDGSTLAQMGNPDMRTPIAMGLAWPERIDAGVPALDLFQTAALHFEAPDEQRFPCLRLAREALKVGGCAPTRLNAANEVAVQAFLDERISFAQISSLIERAITELPMISGTELDIILEADRQTRAYVYQQLQQMRC